MKNIRLANDKDLKNIEKLLDEAFGPGRYARTAYRYREKHNLISEYSYIYQENKKTDDNTWNLGENSLWRP